VRALRRYAERIGLPLRCFALHLLCAGITLQSTHLLRFPHGPARVVYRIDSIT
jgi:hypothetical protein